LKRAAVFFAACCLAVPAAADGRLPETSGARLVAKRCTVCHENPAGRENRHSWIGWQAVVFRMQVLNGAEVPMAERFSIVAHLSDERHPGWAIAVAEWSFAVLGPALVGAWGFWRVREFRRP
jgi:hypothetical protein